MRREERSERIGWRPWAPRGSWAAFVLFITLTPGAAQSQGAGPDTVALVWSAPGDDGEIGTAAVYELRMSPAPIDDANWGAAAVVGGLPAPLSAGTLQRTVVRGLAPGTIVYFALRTADEVGNWSGLSNLMRWDWIYDTAPPAAPVGLSAAPQPGGSVRLDWSPNAEADLAGYVVYRALGEAEPFTALTGSPVQAATFMDSTLPAGTGSVRYQVTARDASGNESARSATASLTLAVGSTAWAVRPVAPNPSGPGRPVSFRLIVPRAGGEARLEILNNIGQRVRRIDLGTLASGTPVVEWDGRNDAGREVAPGAYTAWLIAGGTRVSVRLVRIP